MTCMDAYVMTPKTKVASEIRNYLIDSPRNESISDPFIKRHDSGHDTSDFNNKSNINGWSEV